MTFPDSLIRPSELSLYSEHLTKEGFFSPGNPLGLEEIRLSIMHKLNTQRVTVIGSGNAGLTAAYHLSLNGADVCLYGAPGFDAPLEDIKTKGGIHAIESLNGVGLSFSGFSKIHSVTNDIKEAVNFSDILILPVPSFAQIPLFDSMLPHLKDGQMLVIMPGNYGSLALKKRMQDKGFKLDITFVDAISIPWACRISGPAEVAIMGIKEYLPFSALPASRNQEVLDRLTPVMPLPMKPLKNVIAAGLENINFGGHPLLTTLNMGLLENFKGDFNYYIDCCSEATARAAAVMEEERIQIGHAMSLNLVPELEAMNSLYAMDCNTVYEVNRTSETHGKINSAPDNASHRYITEDAAYLLVPCKEFARLTNTPTPMIDACLTIDNAYNDTDYMKTGRNLEAMGLEQLSVEEIMALVA